MHSKEAGRGVAFGLAAYVIWGFFPLYFKTLTEVDPGEVLAHRIIWSVASLFIYVTIKSGWKKVRATIGSFRRLALLSVSTLLISSNWYVFIYAVEARRVLDTSAGYYISPLINVLLGFLVLGERLKPVQVFAILLALLGVGVKAWTMGELPAISLILAGTFGAYGLVRKFVDADAVTALTVETLLLFPFAIAYAVHLASGGKAAFLNSHVSIDALLAFSGVLTAVPLVFYGAALTRLKLATVGVLQYIVPTLQFMLAVFAFGEEFTRGHMLAFALIWAGISVYTYDALKGAAPQSRT